MSEKVFMDTTEFGNSLKEKLLGRPKKQTYKHAYKHTHKHTHTNIDTNINPINGRPYLSPLAACFNFLVFTIGTAVVVTPYVFSLITPYGAIATEFFLGFSLWVAAVCIFNSANNLNATSFSDLGNQIFSGSPIKRLLNFLLITFPLITVTIGSLASYIVIAANILNNYLPISTVLIKIIICVFTSTLGSVRTFNNMRFISYLCFMLFLSVITLVLIASATISPYIENQTYTFSFHNFVTSIPILLLGVNGHIPLPGMCEEMKKEKRVLMNKCLFVTMFVICILNTIVGLYPSLLFGEDVGDDIVNYLTQLYNTHTHTHTTPLTIILAHITLGVVITVKSPLTIFPLKEIILDRNGITVKDRSIFTNFLTSTSVSFVAGLIAILIPNLSNTLNTATTVGNLLNTGIAAAIISYVAEKGFVAKLRATFLLISGILWLAANFYTIAKMYQPE